MDIGEALDMLRPSAISRSPKNVVRLMWDRLSPLPGGKKLFSRAIGMAAPYTGPIRAEVVTLKKGFAEVTMADRPSVRNHLACVHAVALVNLAEVTGNVALAYSLPDEARFIVAGLSIEYLKKARGTLHASSECPVPETADRVEYEVPVHIWNAAGEEVARATLRTLVGPKSSRGNGQ
jgi:acyl-coenzyme A thioesterase PaaI-like protein